ncbi:hypothetical protein C0581_01495 [Candidatus Parcubacteria bacterium]|nr:MAG: hypothetical protein C0581_01495 [Candidatus Parcubacteria bacterium]
MIKKTARYFWSVRDQLIKYFIVGFSGVFLDVGFLALFSKVFGWNPTISVVLSQIIALIYNFLLNKYWSFANKEMPHQQIVRYSILAGANAIFATGVMYIFNELLGFEELLVRLGTIALSVSWNFFLYKYWVYREVVKEKL